MLTVGSLFSGIGGIDLGLERAGMSVRWQVEIDPWCQRVLAKHWPDVERFADVREVGAHNLASVDVIAGGFPCQDLSYAGKGAGIIGSRSGLWTEYARIIGELRPRYVLVENVTALLRRGIDVVLGDLAALGYDAEWDCVPASALGAPHRRDRVWIVAHTECEGLEGQRRDAGKSPLSESRNGGSLADPAWLWDRRARERAVDGGSGGRGPLGIGAVSEEAVENSERHGLEEPRDRGVPRGWSADPASDAGWWAVEPNVGRVAHGIPQRVDRLRGLGNAVVPQVVEAIGRRIVAWEVNE